MRWLKRFCSFTDTRHGRWMVIAIALVAATSSNHSEAATRDFEGMTVEVVGTGIPLLMIPGLNSAAAVWSETCKALQPQVQCHIVQLPGFAGQAPQPSEHWLDTTRERLLRYLDQEKLAQVSVIGHSLGGVLGMQMALQSPERIERLIIVDSLPFFAAARMPTASVASVLPMAKSMREGMLAADETSYRAQARTALAGMSNQADRQDTLARWGESSDRATTAQAMFEILTTDLRPQLGALKAPTLVLVAWASYSAYGATAESTRAIYAAQYSALSGVRIELSDTGYHFLMWDDPTWLQQQVRQFLKLARSA